MTTKILQFALASALLLGAPLAHADNIDSAEDGSESELTATLEPSTEQRFATRLASRFLTSYHYQSKKLDDELAEEIFENYLELLDPNRMYFLAADIDQLSLYRTQLDDALRSAEIEPAFEIFNLYRERVRARIEQALVLLDSDGFTSIPYFIRVPGPLGRVGELLLWLSSHPALIRAQMQLAFYDPTPHVTPGMVALGSDVLRLPKNRRVLMLMSQRYKDNDLLHSGLRARLGELHIPTLVIWGEHDRVFAPCYGEIASREIPCARLVTIPRCGHFPHIETPRVFHGLLLGFLAKGEHVPSISPGSRVPPRHLPQTCTAEAAAQ